MLFRSSFQTEDDARTYWIKRRDEGATPDELAAIQNAAPNTNTEETA